MEWVISSEVRPKLLRWIELRLLGFYIYPKSEKFAGGIKNMKRRMPMFASKNFPLLKHHLNSVANFGLWCGLYGFGQCALLYTTGYDNHLTEVAAAFFAGFTLDVRSKTFAHLQFMPKFSSAN